jgi:vanillate O-demethylase monooxygenase subunit
MGDEDKCDTDLIPPYHEFGLGEEDWYYSSENYFHLEGRSQLLIDNLMDLTHLPYVHHHLGGGDTMKKTPLEIEDRDTSYRVVRKGKVPWNPFFGLVFGHDAAYEGLADFEVVSDFFGPELIRTGLPTMRKVPGKDEVPKALGTMAIMHAITPETETTTHYFGFSTRNFRQGDESLDKFQYESDVKIRQQDVDVINMVESRLDVSAEAQRELLVPSDVPAVQARRKIQAMLEKENSA